MAPFHYSTHLFQEDPEKYKEYCKQTTCDILKNVKRQLKMQEQKNNHGGGVGCMQCAAMAERERQREAGLAAIIHRMLDLQKLLQRGLDYEPIEMIEDVFRLLEAASSIKGATVDASVTSASIPTQDNSRTRKANSYLSVKQVDVAIQVSPWHLFIRALLCRRRQMKNMSHVP